MFGDLWPDARARRGPDRLGHQRRARPHLDVAPEIADLLARYVLPEWDEAERRAVGAHRRDARTTSCGARGSRPASGWWRSCAAASGSRPPPGACRSDVAWTDEVLDPRVLTIGFARRFATYKRATLLLSQPERLRGAAASTDRPVQIVFAGKAHPADEQGKEMIRQIVAFSADPEVRHRFVFLEDYDIAVARALYQGADVWLNNPRRPLEACGTSGMKAALNGALNCRSSTAGGTRCSTARTAGPSRSAEDVEDLDRRDELEADACSTSSSARSCRCSTSAYGGPVPRRWVEEGAASLRSLGPQVTRRGWCATTWAAVRADRRPGPTALAADGLARARALAAWKARVRGAWHGVHVDSVDGDRPSADLGAPATVEAVVALGDLGADDVEVQLAPRPGRAKRRDRRPSIVRMEPAGGADDDHVRYRDRSERARRPLRVHRPGRPHHPDLVRRSRWAWPPGPDPRGWAGPGEAPNRRMWFGSGGPGPRFRPWFGRTARVDGLRSEDAPIARQCVSVHSHVIEDVFGVAATQHGRRSPGSSSPPSGSSVRPGATSSGSGVPPADRPRCVRGGRVVRDLPPPRWRVVPLASGPEAVAGHRLAARLHRLRGVRQGGHRRAGARAVPPHRPVGCLAHHVVASAADTVPWSMASRSPPWRGRCSTSPGSAPRSGCAPAGRTCTRSACRPCPRHRHGRGPPHRGQGGPRARHDGQAGGGRAPSLSDRLRRRPHRRLRSHRIRVGVPGRRRAQPATSSRPRSG